MDGDSQSSKTYGAVTGIAGKSDVTTANVSSLNETLENSFDKTAVETQFGAQVQVSQAFDTERRTYRLEMAQEQQKTVEEAKKHPVGSAEYNRLMDEANKQQEKMVLFDSITGAIYGPNTNGVTGYVARAVAPEVSFRIGQYFKENHGEGTAPHILAHGILAAAVSAATGNDPTTGALSAMGAEAAAPIVAKFLFGDKPISELTAEQKSTVSSITSLAGLGIGATTGEVGNAVNAGEAAKSAVEDNYLTKISLEKVRKHQLSIQEAEKLSQFLDSEVKKLCSKNPTNDACRTAISSQIQYIAMQEAWETMRNDVSRTSKQTFDYLYNTPNANNRFVLYFNTIDARANFFKASNQYEKNLGVGAKWFGGADYVSRTPLTGLGADGNGSYLTFGASKILGNPDIYSWRSEAGNALITQGFSNFTPLST